MWPILLAVLLIVVLLVLIRCIVIVPQSNDYVVEWLGVYKETWSAGLHLKVPFLERVARRVSLKEEVADFPPQPVITRDNVTMMIDTVVFFQVFDAKAYAYGVNRPIQAIENLSATTLRDIIGSMSLDETLTSRDLINTKITATLDEATDRWGIKVNRIELKNIEPPAEIRQAMEKQMKADREKRASILLAEGEKQAAITRAEGEKESAILRAEAVKEQKIREAEGPRPRPCCLCRRPRPTLSACSTKLPPRRTCSPCAAWKRWRRWPTARRPRSSCPAICRTWPPRSAPSRPWPGICPPPSNATFAQHKNSARPFGRKPGAGALSCFLRGQGGGLTADTAQNGAGRRS